MLLMRYRRALESIQQALERGDIEGAKKTTADMLEFERAAGPVWTTIRAAGRSTVGEYVPEVWQAGLQGPDADVDGVQAAPLALREVPSEETE